MTRCKESRERRNEKARERAESPPYGTMYTSPLRPKRILLQPLRRRGRTSPFWGSWKRAYVALTGRK